MREEEPPRFFQRTSSPAVLVLGPAHQQSRGAVWAAGPAPVTAGSLALQVATSGLPAQGSGAGSNRAARSNWCLSGAQLRPSREQKPPPALELPARGPRRGAGRAPGSGGLETGRPQRTPPNFPALVCRPDGPGTHVDGHMLLDADGRLLPAPPEGHAGSAAARGPARPGMTPARG